LKVCPKKCEQEFAERLEVVRKFRRILTFEGVEGRQEAKYLEGLKEGVATSDHRRTSSVERDTLLSSRRSSQGKDGRSEFSVEILRIPVSR